jgi:transposase-like protein
MVFSRILTDKNKKNEFIKKITNSSSLTSKLIKKFTDIVNDIADQYENEIKEEEKFFNKFKKTKEYKEYTEGIETLLYPKGKVRKFTYTTVPDTSKEETQKANISEIYSTTNTNTNTSTFDGKSKLDS